MSIEHKGDKPPVDPEKLSPRGRRLFDVYQRLREENSLEAKREKEESKYRFLEKIGMGGVVLGVLVILGHMEYRSLSSWRAVGEPVAPQPRLLSIAPICLATEGPPSDKVNIKLTPLQSPGKDTELTLVDVFPGTLGSSLHNLTWKKDGFYVEITNPAGRRIGENGPRPDGSLGMFDKSPQDLRIYKGNKNSINIEKDTPLATLQIDSKTCSY